MKPFSICLCLLALALLPACAGQTPVSRPHTIAPITDFASIAGKWEGLLNREPQQPDQDLVAVVIRDDGAYAFQTYREFGLFKGNGKLTLSGGKAVEQTEKESVTFTLYAEGGQRVLEAKGVAHNGVKYSANLTPKQ